MFYSFIDNTRYFSNKAIAKNQRKYQKHKQTYFLFYGYIIK